MSNRATLLSRLGNAALDALAPRLCPLCGTTVGVAQGACTQCLDLLPPAPFPNELTALIAARGARLGNIERIAARWTFAVDSPVQELIHTLKYNGLRTLARQMGAELGLMLRQFPEFAQATAVVPVPLHSSRLRERGYNQAAEIAAGIAQTLRTARVEEVLVRKRATQTQTRLGAPERSQNVAGAFVLGRALPADSAFLLCDDVCTTSATLDACAAVLQSAGAAHVLAATLAYDDPNAQR